MKRTILVGLAVALGSTCLMAQTAPAQPKISKGEADAYNALVKAAQSGDSDGIIKAADDLTSRYADTRFKANALDMEAAAYHRKGDDDRAQVYAEQAVQADPKDFLSPLLIGETTVQHTRDNDLDKDEKLVKAQKDLELAIENTKAAVKPNPALSDDQWEGYKKDQIAEAQANLGRINMIRKKFNDAITDLQAASAADPQPAYLTWLASSQQLSGKNDDAIVTCDKVLAQPNLPAIFKQVVGGIRADATKAKGAAGKL